MISYGFYITVYKNTFAGFVVCFSMIVSRIWCIFCFVHDADNLALAVRGAIRFIYIFAICFLCFLFCNYVLIMLLCLLMIDLMFSMQLQLIFVKYFMIFMKKIKTKFSIAIIKNDNMDTSRFMGKFSVASCYVYTTTRSNKSQLLRQSRRMVKILRPWSACKCNDMQTWFSMLCQCRLSCL